MSSAKSSPPSFPKRFYTDVGVEAAEGGFAITLDGKRVRTMAKQLLQVPTRKLAEAIAAEWAAQQTHILADQMPLTRLANIALDRVPHDRELLLEDIARYLETDLLCYRAPIEESSHLLAADNAYLRVQQNAAFDPILAWVEDSYGVHIAITEGIMPVLQEDVCVQKIAAAFAAVNDAELAALAMMVPLLGSAFLALAIWQGKVAVEAAVVMARLDEDIQAARWGMDAELAARLDAKARDIRACAFFLDR